MYYVDYVATTTCICYYDWLPSYDEESYYQSYCLNNLCRNKYALWLNYDSECCCCLAACLLLLADYLLLVGWLWLNDCFLLGASRHYYSSTSTIAAKMMGKRDS
jgi:hypothetical protein